MIIDISILIVAHLLSDFLLPLSDSYRVKPGKTVLIIKISLFHTLCLSIATAFMLSPEDVFVYAVMSFIGHKALRIAVLSQYQKYKTQRQLPYVKMSERAQVGHVLMIIWFYVFLS